jgi:hypothetical protein
MYKHVSKCKNDRIKLKINIKRKEIKKSLRWSPAWPWILSPHIHLLRDPANSEKHNQTLF